MFGTQKGLTKIHRSSDAFGYPFQWCWIVGLAGIVLHKGLSNAIRRHSRLLALGTMSDQSYGFGIVLRAYVPAAS